MCECGNVKMCKCTIRIHKYSNGKMTEFAYLHIFKLAH